MEVNVKNELIKEIIAKEYEMFNKVRGLEGRAPCQDDLKSFFVMRYSQHNSFSEATLKSYLKDLHKAEYEGRNLITEKYAYMMEFTDPFYYQDILKNSLPSHSIEKLQLVNEIVKILDEDFEWFKQRYPFFAKKGRPENTESNVATINIYNIGELKTYSFETLTLYKKDLMEARYENKPIVEKIQNQTAIFYGYKSVKEAENHLKKR
ncbi:MAG: DUF4125 family protein [Filifactoraceae bacterium]